MSEGRYEMQWDCPHCDTRGLLGLTHRHCPSCGAAQDPTRRYYPPDDARVAVVDHPFYGADLACPACESPNARAAQFCVNCGSGLEGAKAVGTRESQNNAEGKFAADDANRARAEAEARKQAARSALAEAPGKPAARSRFSPWVVALGLLAVTLCLGIGVAVFWKKDTSLTVAGHAWEREIAVDVYTTVSDSAWRDQLPAGARSVMCRQEQRSTTQVPDGEDCHDVRSDNGDGTFSVSRQCTPRTRSEPVYDERCSFTADVWQPKRTARAAGTGLHPPPAWPDPQVRGGLGLGAEREGLRTERYTVQLTDAAGGTHTCALSEAAWASLAPGSEHSARIGVVTGMVDCGSLGSRP